MCLCKFFPLSFIHEISFHLDYHLFQCEDWKKETLESYNNGARLLGLQWFYKNFFYGVLKYDNFTYKWNGNTNGAMTFIKLIKIDRVYFAKIVCK